MLNDKDKKNSFDNWMINNKDLILIINSMCLHELKMEKENIEKELIKLQKKKEKNEDEIFLDRMFKLEYVKTFLNFLNKNINQEQYMVLTDFSKALYYYKHFKENEKEKFNDSFWNQRINESNITLEIKEIVNVITDEKLNKAKYLITHLRKHGINIVDELSEFSIVNS